MMDILITGGKGQLGSELERVFRKDHLVYCWDIEELDFTNSIKTFEKVYNLNPDLIVHAGANTDVKGCELDPDNAYLVNWIGTRNIATVALQLNIPVVYLSTDYVFDGNKEEPYLEIDRPNPLNVYGKSKLAGEEIIKNLLQKYYIVRTSWLYSTNGDNFVNTILKLVKNRDCLKVISDQVGTPTYVKDLAWAIAEMIKMPFYGTYHISNKGQTSWHQLVKAIFEINGVTDIDLKPIKTQEYCQKVKRPAFSVLENFNLENTYNLKLRFWRDALEDCLNNY